MRLSRLDDSHAITDQHSTAGRATSRVGITRTVPPGRSDAVRGYPATARPSHDLTSAPGTTCGHRGPGASGLGLFAIHRDPMTGELHRFSPGFSAAARGHG